MSSGKERNDEYPGEDLNEEEPEEGGGEEEEEAEEKVVGADEDSSQDPEQEGNVNGETENDMARLISEAEASGIGIVQASGREQGYSPGHQATSDYVHQFESLTHEEEAHSNHSPLGGGYLGLPHEDFIGNEQAGGNFVPMEPDFLQLSRDLCEEDATFLAWYLREMYPAMEHQDTAIGAFIRNHSSQFNGLLPNPSKELIARSQKETRFDLVGWMESRRNNKQEEPRAKKRKIPSPSDDGQKEKTTRKPNRPPKYKCPICKEIKEGHSCRPTFDQIVDEVKRRLKARKKAQAVSRSTKFPIRDEQNRDEQKRPDYKCGLCRVLKRKHNCPYRIFERSAIRVENTVRKGQNKATLDKLIRRDVESNFKFGNDGRMIPSTQPDADMGEISDGFKDDGGSDDAGIIDTNPNSGSNTEHAALRRSVPEQALHHIAMLRQEGQARQAQPCHEEEPSSATEDDGNRDAKENKSDEEDKS